MDTEQHAASQTDGAPVGQQTAGGSTLGKLTIWLLVAFMAICVAIGVWRAMSDRSGVSVTPAGSTQYVAPERKLEPVVPCPPPEIVAARRAFAEQEATPKPQSASTPGSVRAVLGEVGSVFPAGKRGWTTAVVVNENFETALDWETIPIETHVEQSVERQWDGSTHYKWRWKEAPDSPELRSVKFTMRRK